jgi:hypothetical protein
MLSVLTRPIMRSAVAPLNGLKQLRTEQNFLRSFMGGGGALSLER